MPSPKIRVDHDALQAIARTFGQGADATGRTLRQLKSAMGVLQSGDWIGQGASKFYEEMNSQVLPAVQRLNSALAESAKVTGQISQLMKQAEEEAARILRGEGAGVVGVIAAALGGALGAAAAAAAAASKIDSRAEADHEGLVGACLHASALPRRAPPGPVGFGVVSGRIRRDGRAGSGPRPGPGGHGPR